MRSVNQKVKVKKRITFFIIETNFSMEFFSEIKSISKLAPYCFTLESIVFVLFCFPFINYCLFVQFDNSISLTRGKLHVFEHRYIVSEPHSQGHFKLK